MSHQKITWRSYQDITGWSEQSRDFTVILLSLFIVLIHLSIALYFSTYNDSYIRIGQIFAFLSLLFLVFLILISIDYIYQEPEIITRIPSRKNDVRLSIKSLFDQIGYNMKESKKKNVDYILMRRNLDKFRFIDIPINMVLQEISSNPGEYYTTISLGPTNITNEKTILELAWFINSTLQSE